MFHQCVSVQPTGNQFDSPDVFTIAAAEHADQEGDDDDSTENRQSDYQGLEVHCRAKTEKHKDDVRDRDRKGFSSTPHLVTISFHFLH